MRILLVNDDGFDSPLLAVLCRACSERGHKVLVSAPDTQQSARSHAFTLTTPILCHEAQMEGADRAFRIEGTPVDSARVGFMSLAEEPVDLVISGINRGYNMGLATFVSGTVGAAREAAFHGLPAMAVSVHESASAETAMMFARYCVRMGEKLVQTEMPEQSVCNINCPALPWSEIREPRICRMERHVYLDAYVGQTTPRGIRCFWLEGEQVKPELDSGSDESLLREGHLTVTILAPEGCDQSRFTSFPLPKSAVE